MTSKPTATAATVAVSKIKTAPYNPTTRTEINRLTRLMASIVEAGEIFVPLLMTPDYHLIDGHRRLACAEQLGFKTVPAYIRPMTPAERKHAYASINSTVQTTRSSDALQVWLKEPEAVSYTRRKQFEAMVERIGRPLVVKMAARGYSPHCYKLAVKIGNYCGMDTNAFLIQTVKWIMTHNAQNQVRLAMQMDQPGTKLVAAIKANRRLKMAVVAE
jgi:hypothetical protein